MQRTIRTDLVMNVSGYVGPLQQADRATTAFTQRGSAQLQAYSTQVGAAFAAIGAAIGLVLVSAAKDTLAFEKTLTQMVTLAGASREEVDEMGQAALRLGETGKGPLELADAMYFVASSGIKGAAGLEVAEESAKAASLGLGDTAVVADLASSAVNAYGQENLSASHAIDVMVQAVREGKAEASDMAGSLGRVLPIASEMGVTFEETAGAVAALTRTGSDSAEAVTQLRGILSSLLNPAQQSEEALNAIGLSSERLRDTIQQEGLWAAMQLLRSSIGDNDAALGKILPNVRALAGFLSLTGENAELNAQIFENMANSTGVGAEAFEEWSQTGEAALARFSAALESAGIAGMEGLETVLRPVMDTLTSLLNRFIELPGPVRTGVTAVSALLAIIGVLGGGFLILLPRILATRVALQALAVSAPRAAAGLRAIGTAATAATAVLALAAALDMLTKNKDDFVTGSGEVELALRNLRSGLDSEFVDRARDAYERFVNTVKVLGVTVPKDFNFTEGFKRGHEAAAEFEAQVEAVDTALAAMVSGGAVGDAEESVRAFAVALGVPNDEINEFVNEHFPQYQDALKGIEAGSLEAAEGMTPIEQELETLAGQFGIVGEEASQAAQEMVNEWNEASSKFVDLLGAYQTKLDELTQAEQDWAQAQADTFNEENPDSPTRTWEDYARAVEVSLADVNEALEEQIIAQQEWQENLAILAKRGVEQGLLAELARLGPEGAPLVKALADASDKELQRWVELMGQRTEEGTDSIAANLIKAQPDLETIGRNMGDGVMNNLIDGMVRNGTSLQEEARRQGINIDRALDPYGNVTIEPEVNGRSLARAREQIASLAKKRQMQIDVAVRAYESGRSVSYGYQPAHGGQVGSYQPIFSGEARGPGGPWDDQAGLYMLSNREWVIRAVSAMKYGSDRMRAVNEGRAIISLPGEAQGGRNSPLEILMGRLYGATDFLNAVKGIAGRVAATSPRFAGSMSFAGHVLPAGTYRIGQGPAGHGYNARDLPAPIGTPVYAAAAGIVSRALRLATSYGIHAVIQHAGWRTLYAHMSQLYVRAGQQVLRGQMIGRVGSTGNSTGPHLHLEPDLPRLYRDYGGYVPRGWSLIHNGTGGPEFIFNRQQMATLAKIVAGQQVQRSLSYPDLRPSLPSISYDQRTSWTINGAPEEIMSKISARQAYDRIARRPPSD